MIANVPSDAKLRVDVYDKDEGSLSPSFPSDLHIWDLFTPFRRRRVADDFAGSFTTWISDGAQVQTLTGMTGADRGVFGFQVRSYTFDTPTPKPH